MPNALLIPLVLLLAVGVTWLGRRVGRLTRRRLEGASSASETISLQRRTTIARAVSSAVSVTGWTVAAIVILVRLHVDVAAVLTTASVAGLVLAFAAQNVVRDVTVGVFVVLENQYDVGDRLTMRVGDQTLEGWAQGVSFRRTDLELDDGTVAFVGHGQVVYVVNRSRGHGSVSVVVHAPRDVDIERARAALDQSATELRGEPRISRMLFGPPQIEQGQGNGETLFAMHLETRPERRDEVARDARGRIVRRMAAVSDEIQVEG